MKKLIYFLSILALISCKNKRIKPDVDKIKVSLSIMRFEKDIFESDFDRFADSIPHFKSKYGDFFKMFNYKILKIGDSDNPSYPDNLKKFVTDYYANKTYKKVLETYPDLTDLTSKLELAFKYYKFYFPEMKIPHIYTFISLFNQSIVTSDSVLGIGLDKYLGKNCEYYSKVGFESYLRYKMNKEKILSDCILGWAMTQYEFDDKTIDDNLINNMLYQGKIIYLTKQILPDEPDSLIFGFPEIKLKFCNKNEEQMWTFLVEHKLLFNTEYITINKFTGEGPFTKDFTNQSPSRAAVWIGYRIIDSYMNKNSKISLQQLMMNNDYQQILKQSKYHP